MRTGICALFFFAACGWSLQAQQSAPTQSGAAQSNSDTSASQDAQQPLTPEQQREEQIRKVDPLARDDKNDDKAANDRDKAADKQNGQQRPAPGSIAESEQASPPATPQVVSGDDSGDEQTPEYTGPAVLSRSYSVGRPLVPDDLKWMENLGVSAVLDTGAVGEVNANGSLNAANLAGARLSWGLAGKHEFHRDTISFNYIGNYSQYPGNPAYDGSNNTLALRYIHTFTRRLSLNVSTSGAIFTQNYPLDNQSPAPETTLSNLSISSSPGIQITNVGTKQFSTAADLTWQKSARLSFSGGATYFLMDQSEAGLLGMTGRQARGDMNYRLTRKLTVGTYYQFNEYMFPHGWGTSRTNTFGGILSYAFSRTLQLRTRAGISQTNSEGLQDIQVPAQIAALIGQTSGLIDVSSSFLTTDVSAQLVKDLRHGRTASVAFAHGISPGNGLYLTSVQESYSANFATPAPFFRRYLLQFTVGRDTLSAVMQSLSSYASEYAVIAVSRPIGNGVSASFSTSYRHMDLAEIVIGRNQFILNAGINWGSTNGRLWPF